MEKRRCDWSGSDLFYQRYHDEEWGVPCHIDAKLFEFLILEGAQAGLSWLTILRRRENYRLAFADFDVKRVSQFTADDIGRLQKDSGIIRNRAKIASAINNACCFLSVQQEFGSFSDYLWGFSDGVSTTNYWTHQRQVPTQTPLSKALSDDMRRRGFNFFGPTICYAYLQAMGVVNDHEVGCFRHSDCSKM